MSFKRHTGSPLALFQVGLILLLIFLNVGDPRLATRLLNAMFGSCSDFSCVYKYLI
jgi:hypothetical protein